MYMLKSVHENEYIDFIKLVNIIYEKAEFISFKKADWLNSTDKSLEKELLPYCFKTIKSEKWFGYDFITNREKKHIKEIDIQIYKLNQDVKNILFEYCNDIWMEEKKKEHDTSTDYTIEDMCFFDKSGIIAGTISHEKIFAINSLLYQDERIREMGDWEECSITSSDINYRDIMID